MTRTELIDRLCRVNVLLTDIVREQAYIMEQYGIEEIQQDDGAASQELHGLNDKIERAYKENDAIEVQLRRII